MSLLFGTNNYVYVPYDSGLNGITNALTVSCWVNLTAASSMQMFINRMVSATPGNEWWSLNLMNQALRLGATALARAVPNAEGEVCSEFLASTMRDAGFDIKDTLLSPQGLYNLIQERGWIYEQIRIK